MKKNNWIKDLIIYQNELSKLRVKCSCGHTKTIPVFLDKVRCNYCGKTVYNNTKLHFMYKMNKLLKEKKNEK